MNWFYSLAKGDDNNDGKAWATAFKTRARALEFAQPGDTIYCDAPIPIDLLFQGDVIVGAELADEEAKR